MQNPCFIFFEVSSYRHRQTLTKNGPEKLPPFPPRAVWFPVSPARRQ
ncbi:MAG: hypothetical protein HWN79_19340 [Candidatus Lokiarchaeota archaeon]|nr:hypothetical protein [Candidatus Lokiarchaeota archaeon]